MAEELEKQEPEEMEESEEEEAPEETVDVKGLVDKIQMLEQKIQTYEHMMAQAQQPQQPYNPDDYVEIPEPEEYVSPFEELDEDELEGMSRKQLIKLLKEDVKGELAATVLPEVMGEVYNDLDQLKAGVAEFIVKVQIDEARQKYPDFDVFVPAMRELSQQYPNLDVEKLYHLAKSGHQPASPSSASSPGPAPRKPSGFKRSGKPGSMKPVNEFKTYQEAISEAWDEIMGGSGGE